MACGQRAIASVGLQKRSFLSQGSASLPLVLEARWDPARNLCKQTICLQVTSASPQACVSLLFCTPWAVAGVPSPGQVPGGLRHAPSFLLCTVSERGRWGNGNPALVTGFRREFSLLELASSSRQITTKPPEVAACCWI